MPGRRIKKVLGKEPMEGCWQYRGGKECKGQEKSQYSSVSFKPTPVFVSNIPQFQTYPDMCSFRWRFKNDMKQWLGWLGRRDHWDEQSDDFVRLIKKEWKRERKEETNLLNAVKDSHSVGFENKRSLPSDGKPGLPSPTFKDTFLFLVCLFISLFLCSFLLHVCFLPLFLERES